MIQLLNLQCLNNFSHSYFIRQYFYRNEEVKLMKVFLFEKEIANKIIDYFGM